MELNCPSLDYVNEMTWAEFRIRMYGYNRMQESENIRAREIAWNSLIGPSRDSKKLPKTREKFWPIGEKSIEVNDQMQEAIKKAQEQFIKDKKKLNNG